MKCMVTGVSRGIGRATAIELLRQGHSVWGISRTTPSDLSGLDHAGFKHSFCDISDMESRGCVAREMDSAGFIPDIVILNAASEYEEKISTLSWEKMQMVLRTNVEGALFWVSHWLDRQPSPSMQFIGISTLLAIWPDADCPAYSTSKSALSMAFRSFRLRYVDEPVRFKLLYLGPVQTSINPRFSEGGAPGRGVVTPEAVSGYIVNTVLSNRRFSFYYPWMTGLVCRFGSWMPDLLFEWITRPLRR